MSGSPCMQGKGATMPKTLRVTDIDKKVGQRIRTARLQANISQESLGKAMGLTFQQIQKYEKGVNALSPTRLVALCKVLDVSLAYLFGMNGKHSDKRDDVIGVLQDRASNDLMEAFDRIEDTLLRNALVHLVEAMVKVV